MAFSSMMDKGGNTKEKSREPLGDRGFPGKSE
jgi:hypothetical protein